jgi:hypothetical protein
MNVAVPNAAPTAGSTVCVTVTGTNGPLKAVGSGSLTVVSIVQSASRPTEWTVCVSVGAGRGKLHLEDSATTKSVGLAGR